MHVTQPVKSALKIRRAWSNIQLPSWPARNPAVMARALRLLGSSEMDSTTFSADDLCHIVLEIFKQAGLPALLAGDLGRVKRCMLAVRNVICHDLEHPGVSSPFIARAGQKIAGAFKDALLEKHHALRAFEVMVDSSVVALPQHGAGLHPGYRLRTPRAISRKRALARGRGIGGASAAA